MAEDMGPLYPDCGGLLVSLPPSARSRPNSLQRGRDSFYGLRIPVLSRIMLRTLAILSAKKSSKC